MIFKKVIVLIVNIITFFIYIFLDEYFTSVS